MVKFWENLKVAGKVLIGKKLEEGEKKSEPSVLAYTSKKQEHEQRNDNVRFSTRKLQTLYNTNQFCFRALNIRSNELTTRGFKIIDGDAKGRKLCEELIKRSGGITFFRQLCLNVDLYGDGFAEIIWTKDKKDIYKLQLIHPVTFGFKKDKRMGNILLDSKGRPISYEQKYVNPKTEIEESVDVPIEKVLHVIFNRIGDEFIGISILQPVYNTVVRLMNIEDAAAVAAWRTANPVWVGETDTSSQDVLKKWGKEIGDMSTADQILLPKGVKFKMVSPGQTNFPEYEQYFINSICAATGIPKFMLSGDAQSSNRATAVVQSRHFLSLIEFNQEAMAQTINEAFEKYAEAANPKFKAPKLIFNEIIEDASTKTDDAIKLVKSGLISEEEGRMLIGIEETLGNSVKNKVKMSNKQAERKSERETWRPTGKAKKPLEP